MKNARQLQFRRRRTVIGVVAALLLAAVGGRVWRLTGAHGAEAATAGTRSGGPIAVPVAVATAARADVPVKLSALGSVTAFNTVTRRAGWKGNERCRSRRPVRQPRGADCRSRSRPSRCS